jgi:protein-disulfide isomerase
MSQQPKYLTAILVVVGLCAVVSTGVTVMNALRPTTGVVTELSRPEPRAIDNWLEYAAEGHRIGAAGAPVALVVFSDFECPYCQRFASGGLRELRERFGDSVAVIFRHLPLPNHKLAKHVAKAAVCAADAGRFVQFHDAVFAKSDSIGLKSMEAFARDAGVTDGAAFASCMSSPTADAIVARDLEASSTLELTGTPSILIDGTLRLGAIGGEELIRIVEPLVARSRR